MEETVSTEVAEESQIAEPAEELTDEPVVEEVIEEPPEPIEPRKKTAQERIDEITRARREAEREVEYWRKIALEKESPETSKVSPVPPVPSIPQRPTFDQFETTVEYEDALFGWYEKKKEIETREVKQQVEFDESLRIFNQRARKIREDHEDFDEVIESPVFSPIMRLAILHSENGPSLAYHLGKPENREVAEKIRRMSNEMQPYEIGKLETQLLLTQQTKKVSSAPKPISPVGMTSGGKEDPSKMTIDEWMVWDKKRAMEKIKSKLGG